ncbi:MAG: hypothetical protein JW870_03205 [Candidatus Delongbacteria bacterium]|nr:hypothetical protein [Candidatus Delongbacteria bacterium]
MLKELLNFFSSLNPQKIIGLAIFIVLLLILFPFIDKNIIQPSKLGQEIGNLEKLTQIDKSKLNERPELLQAYNNIISRMNDNYIIKINNDSLPWWLKFISGGFLSWLLLLIIPFIKTNRLRTAFVIIILGGILGGIGILIPSFDPIQINIFLYPALQLALLITVSIMYSKKNKT